MKRIAYTGLLVGLLAGTTAAQSESVWDQDFMDSYHRTGQAVDDFGPSSTPTAGRSHFPKLGGVFQKLKERRQNSKSGSGVVLQDAVPAEDALGPGATSVQETGGVEAAQGDSVEPAELPAAAPTDPWAGREPAEPYPHSRRGLRMPSLHIIPRGRFFPRSGRGADDYGLGTGGTLHDVVPAEHEGQPGSAPPAELPLGQQSSSELAEASVCDRCGKPWSSCHCDGHDWKFFGEYLLLQPRGADPVFALRAPTCLQPPTGTEQIDFGMESGFRVGFEKELGDGFSTIGANFAHFEMNDDRRANPTTGGAVLVPIVAFDPAATCGGSTSTIASATADINFDRVSLDYRRYIECGNCKFDWLAGFAYGQLTQDLKARFDEDRVAVDTGAWGYGVHVGGGMEYGLGCLRGFGHADLTLLASNVKADYTQTNAFDGQIAHFEQNLDRIIPVLDLELGVAVDVCRNTVIKAGYLYSIWFNVVTTPDFIDAVQGLKVDGSVSDTLTFDGVFVRLEHTW